MLLDIGKKGVELGVPVEHRQRRFTIEAHVIAHRFNGGSALMLNAGKMGFSSFQVKFVGGKSTC